MSRARVLAAVLVVLLVAAWGIPSKAEAKKPEPPAPGPTIVGAVIRPTSNYELGAVDSDGWIYAFQGPAWNPDGGVYCGGIHDGTIIGRLFDGPPPARIVSTDWRAFAVWREIMVVLEDGDVWYWCNATTPSQTTYAGNIFQVTNTTARTPDFRPQTFTPAFPSEPEPERQPVREGAVK